MNEPTFSPRYKGLFLISPFKRAEGGFNIYGQLAMNAGFAHGRLTDLLAFWSLTIS